ncbi:MAG: S8 family serine peptidase, partial [Bifidobacteriaceae bacterium]|nr:S8 family serine peptidase [Bifidobacteriaceae bacterium]
MLLLSPESSRRRHFRRFAAAAIPPLVLGLIGVGVVAKVGDDKSAETAYGNAPVASEPVAAKVRLITGDVVRVAADGSVGGIEAGPRSDGTSPRFSTWTKDSHTFVFPSDVIGLIGDSLDRALFDVTELASYERRSRETTVPVIVQTNQPAAQSLDLAELGVEVERTLETIPAQAGEALADTDTGPAPAWDLIEAAAEPAADSPVEKVWLNREVKVEPLEDGDGGLQLLEPGETPEWMELIGADSAWDGSGLTGEGITVAVADTGIDFEHADLAGQQAPGEYEADFTGSDSASDEQGHGTFVASEIAGTGAAHAGVYKGVAPGAKLLNARVLDAEGSGDNAGIMAGIEWAAEQGADIINLSLGDWFYGDGTSLFDVFVDDISAEYGCLIVAAAGNDYYYQAISSPASANSALAVGATTQDGEWAAFSSGGPRRGDGAVKPEVVAPGIGTQVVDEETGEITEWPGIVGAAVGPENGYIEEAGTSMSAPLVAGAAALLLEADGTLDNDALRAKLMGSAKPMPDGSSVFAQGAGLIDIPAALDQTVTADKTELNLGAQPYPQSEVTAELTFTNSSPAAVTIDGALTFVKSVGPAEPDPYDYESGATESPWGDISDLEIGELSQEHITVSPSVVGPGATVTVNVSIDAGAFGAGYIGGYVWAKDSADALAATVPIGLANEPQKHTLTVDATGRSGQPLDQADQEYGNVEVFDFDYGFSHAVPLNESGTGSVDLVDGRYVVSGYAESPNELGGSDSTLLTAPLMEVDSDTTVELDGSPAELVSVPLSQPVEGAIVAQASVTEETEESWMRYGVGVIAEVGPQARERLYITPVEDAEGTWEWTYIASAALAEPRLEAALDACGTEPLTVLDTNYLTPFGHQALTVVDAAGGAIAPSSAADQAVLVRFDEGILDVETNDQLYETLDQLSDLVEQAQDGDYAALVIASADPWLAQILAFSAVDYRAFLGLDTTIPVLAVSEETADQVEANDGKLYLLTRSPGYVYELSQALDPAAGPYELDTSSEALATVTV